MSQSPNSLFQIFLALSWTTGVCFNDRMRSTDILSVFSVNTIDTPQKEHNHMNQTRILTLFLVAVGLLSGVLIERTISASTNAQQTGSTASERWEYCVITGVIWDNERRNHYARICYFRPSGCQETEIEGPQLADNEFGGIAIQKTVAKASATLGQNGWEMVGEFSGYGDRDQQRLYFKRRLR
jgi:hypothetical protein